MNYRKEKEKEMKLTPKIYDMILHAFETEHRNERKQINYNDVIVALKKEMKIMQMLQVLIYGESLALGSKVTALMALNKLKEFNFIKQILYGCSISDGTNLVIYPENMKSIMYEIKMSSRLHELHKAWDENLNAKQINKIYEESNKISPDHNKDNDAYLSKMVILIIS
jgi:hypothetical protein